MGALMLIQTCSLSLAKNFMREALQGLAVICFVCKILHLFMDLSCDSQMWARRDFVFIFTLLVSVRYSVIFKFPDVEMRKITLMFSDVVPLSSAIWRDRSGEGKEPGGCHGEFSRTGLGAKLFLRCDSSGLQSRKACCCHSHRITWTVTMPPQHEDVKTRQGNVHSSKCSEKVDRQQWSLKPFCLEQCEWLII